MSKKEPRLAWTVYNGAVYGLGKQARSRDWTGLLLLAVWVVLLAGLFWLLLGY